ncbi:Leucine-rich repeat-containing protein 28 [Pleurostoma richardsiae]|uniref:Leucine-rich repeat-containing protein 28 n=1 Tax=Pleurostoma richardsiae TaxID=41990 RepID=A0AA38VZX0_9PEZI|nr:Leucine-rich repeat-containing protein 28 [Pleurostoma richardsiae]
MQDLETLREGGYKSAGLTKLKLSCPLDAFPSEILELGDTLEQLDLSGTGLSSLPPAIGAKLPNLRVAFFSQCGFGAFPRELASCPRLEMVAFRGNGMAAVPEDALPPRLRWLILTDNRIEALPRSIGRCTRLQKCMLAGNRLRALPAEMRACERLALLRLSSNRLEELPEWLFEMPELAFLSFAGNPCSTPGTPASLVNGNVNGIKTNEESNAVAATVAEAAARLARVPWSHLEVHHTLGEGASGIISKGVWQAPDGLTGEEVAIKLFKGALTSDGAPEDEMAACISAGRHDNIIDVLGRVHDHPDEAEGEFRGGLVMQLVPPHYRTLGGPPSLQTCTRDCYPEDARLSVPSAMGVLEGVAAAAGHLHENGVAHGDLYAHNILHTEDGHALLGDFGAATVHGGVAGPPDLLERLEVLAFAHLIEDVMGLVEPASEAEKQVVEQLGALHRKCSVKTVSARPTFADVIGELKKVDGSRDSARLPN